MTTNFQKQKKLSAYYSPSEQFPELFERVAMSNLVDAKDWVDLSPVNPVDKIVSEYNNLDAKTDEDILCFVRRNFTFPSKTNGDAKETTPGTSMREHISNLWPNLTRAATREQSTSSLLPLPHPFLVPGGRFREVYYWDTYFTMLGLPDEYASLKNQMVANFAYMIRSIGFVPNGNRSYYLSRSQPPFFFMMVDLLSEEEQSKFLDALLIEHSFWMHGSHSLPKGSQKDRVVKLQDGSVLNRYYDDRCTPRDESYSYDVHTASLCDREASSIYRDIRAGAESGWDFSSRWLADGQSLSSIQTTNILPIDLNSILYGMELKISSLARRAEQLQTADHFKQAAEIRKNAIRTHLWSAEHGYYCDFDISCGARKSEISAAALFPLFFNIADEDEAALTANAVDKHLLAKGGLLTTPVDTGQQWDSPNGWAPLTWIAVAGLRAYSADGLAENIAKRWLETTSRTFAETGRMVEKYNVVDAVPGGGGEYELQDGFGWTNGVTIALLNMYPDHAHFGETPFAPQKTIQSNALNKVRQ